ncbi:hypothetical protein L1987_00905 [Smallanthus sonchifolius]|uniref:Uncharacterized protein n=1 Tax=Smallanthus sonchifolius TaxID=185202 RepID=A0ACB9K3L6_9ASTR|nr:hypothetical protein L1987_00905 [Smallanthus sonchifolius]
MLMSIMIFLVLNLGTNSVIRRLTLFICSDFRGHKKTHHIVCVNIKHAMLRTINQLVVYRISLLFRSAWAGLVEHSVFHLHEGLTHVILPYYT